MKNIAGKTPVLLTIIFIPLGIICAYLKLSSWTGVMQVLGIATIAFYILWIFAEMRVTTGEIKKGKSDMDKGSCELYGLARSITLISALLFPTLWETNGYWAIIGPLLLVGGVIFRLVAIRNLGKFYSHRVRLIQDQEVISSGPYRIVRHPAYTGMFVANMGIVLFFFNWVSFAILFFVFLPSIINRIKIEEINLLKLKGYKEYSEKKYRLIPLLW